jgi:hypothetical protein
MRRGRRAEIRITVPSDIAGMRYGGACGGNGRMFRGRRRGMKNGVIAPLIMLRKERSGEHGYGKEQA